MADTAYFRFRGANFSARGADFTSHEANLTTHGACNLPQKGRFLTFFIFIESNSDPPD
ncbi:MAG: hypothetical protein JNJ65_02915 [Cyclobacteriaceae bacterium]|nr:hypothetical protein [Cyclobacteriaceae bacterium]